MSSVTFLVTWTDSPDAELPLSSANNSPSLELDLAPVTSYDDHMNLLQIHLEQCSKLYEISHSLLKMPSQHANKHSLCPCQSERKQRAKSTLQGWSI